MHILLIGTGYVGMALLSSWQTPNDRFVVTTTTGEKLEKLQSHKNVERALLLTIDKETDLKAALDGCDAVVVTVAPKSGASYTETYLETSHCLKKALSHREKPLLLIYTSSTSVYGDQEGCLADELSTKAPQSEGSRILSQTEDTLLSCNNPQVEVCVLRLGGIYGPERTLEKRAMMVSKKGVMEGSGDEPTNHIHLNDITGAIEFCVKNRLAGVYNLVNDDHPSRRNLYNTLCSKLNIPSPTWDAKVANTLVTNADISNQKIKNAGYRFSQPQIHAQRDK